MDLEVKGMKVKAMRYVVKAAALTASATSQVITIPGPPANTYLLDLQGKVNTAFAGVTQPTVKVGHVNITESLMPKQGISTAKYLKGGGRHKGFCEAMSAITGNQNIKATFESTSGNMSSMSAGEVEFVLVWAERA